MEMKVRDEAPPQDDSRSCARLLLLGYEKAHCLLDRPGRGRQLGLEPYKSQPLPNSNSLSALGVCLCY